MRYFSIHCIQNLIAYHTSNVQNQIRRYHDVVCVIRIVTFYFSIEIFSQFSGWDLKIIEEKLIINNSGLNKS